MRRLIKEMKACTTKQINAAEPNEPPRKQEMFVALMPLAGRQIATVLKHRLDELHDRIRWHVLGNHDTIEDEITKLRLYVDFINSTLIYELEELVPEIADLRRRGALITFRKKWQICALKGAMRPDEGVPMDVVADYVAELLLNEATDVDKRHDEPPEPDFEPPDPNFSQRTPPDLDDIPGAWTDDNIAYQMEKAGWFEKAVAYAQRGQNVTGDDAAGDEDDGDDEE